MMRIKPVIFLLALASCGQDDSSNLQVDQAFDQALAGQTITSLPAEARSAKVLMVCGPSLGKGFEFEGDDGSWVDDGISNGRIAFIWPDHGAPDVYFRDVTGQWLSATADGGDVRLLTEDEQSGEQVWTVSYPRTGVTETHNIELNGSEYADVWTSNKPGSIARSIRRSAKIFTSNCIRP